MKLIALHKMDCQNWTDNDLHDYEIDEDEEGEFTILIGNAVVKVCDGDTIRFNRKEEKSEETQSR